MIRCHKLLKTIQRRIYDFLSTKYGLALLCFSILVIIVCLLQLSDTILEYRLAQFKRFADVMNLKNASIILTINYNLQNKTSLDYDSNGSFNADDDSFGYVSNVDVVYTWVNGSDPAHLENLKKYKVKNKNNTLQYVKIEFDKYVQKIANKSESESATPGEDDKAAKNEAGEQAQENALWPCFHKFCIQTYNLIVIIPQLRQTDKQNFLSAAKNVFDSNLFADLSIDSVDHLEHNIKDQQGSKTTNLSILYINNHNFRSNLTLLNQINDLFKRVLSPKPKKTSTQSIKYKMFMGYYTIDCSFAPNCIKNINRTFIIKPSSLNKDPSSVKDRMNSFYVYNRVNQLPANAKESSNRLELPKYLENNLLYKYEYVHTPASVFDGFETTSEPSTTTSSRNVMVDKSKTNKNDVYKSSMATHLSVFKVKTRDLDSNLSFYLSEDFQEYDIKSTRQAKLFKFNSTSNKTVSYDLYRANIAWDLGDPLAEDVAENRFFDNDELKYSMRSLEKYAPWIRNVYLVTNGQVPSWLNLTHPKVKLVTHADIFLNKSHLPTFSSPAIESHLHRIKGLSKRFIYFNDDVLLGKKIYPDEFFTLSRGFKFHLAWALPGCNPKCPNSWINDGYCDKACNTSECDFDGGDCDRNKTSNRGSPYDNARLAFVNQSQLVFPGFYCSPGCSTSWLADRYCDNACNNKNCAFDMGDCGLAKFNELFEVKLFDSAPKGESSLLEKTLSLPTQITAFYLNFTCNEAEHSIRILNANYEENKLVRTISVVNKFHVLTVLLMPSANSENATSENEEMFKIYLNANLNNSLVSSSSDLNMTLTVKLNAYAGTFETELNSSTPVNNENLITTGLSSAKKTTKNNTIKIDYNELNPKNVHKKLNIDKRENITQLYPANVKFSFKLLQNLYENYFEYLNYSHANEYISDDGFHYKLKRFQDKLNNQVKKSYLDLLENFDKNKLDAGDKQDRLLYDLLFSNDTALLNRIDKEVLISKYLNESGISYADTNETNIFIRFRKRKLLDTFADSLKYVNRLFNQIYGYTPRKVPAHMPHLIDRQIMIKLQEKFSDEFEKTSANRLRSSTDMQYAFTYYYYVMSELEQFDEHRLFDEFDLNMNGLLDDSELMVVNLKLSSRPFSLNQYAPHEASISDMISLNKEFSDSLNKCRPNRTEKRLNKTEFASCTPLVEYLKDKFWENSADAKFKYKFETVGDEDTKFVMIGGDPLDIEVKLSNLIREPKKFICLNDNIDYKLKNEAAELKRILKNFYSYLYPLKSSFEKSDMASNEVEFSSSKNSNSRLLNTGVDLSQIESVNSKESQIYQNDTPLLKFNFREHYDRFIFNLIVLVLFVCVFIYVIKKIFSCLFMLLKYIVNQKLNLNLFEPNESTEAADTSRNRKSKGKSKKREHKISNALRQKIEETSRLLTGSSSSISDEENLNSSSNAKNTSGLLNKNIISSDRKEVSSIGIVMRSKNNRKPPKKLNISNI